MGSVITFVTSKPAVIPKQYNELGGAAAAD
jgi:hypothetical protein